MLPADKGGGGGKGGRRQQQWKGGKRLRQRELSSCKDEVAGSGEQVSLPLTHWRAATEDLHPDRPPHPHTDAGLAGVVTARRAAVPYLFQALRLPSSSCSDGTWALAQSGCRDPRLTWRHCAHVLISTHKRLHIFMSVSLRMFLSWYTNTIALRKHSVQDVQPLFAKIMAQLKNWVLLQLKFFGQKIFKKMHIKVN